MSNYAWKVTPQDIDAVIHGMKHKKPVTDELREALHEKVFDEVDRVLEAVLSYNNIRDQEIALYAEIQTILEEE